jgi:hypothetical protein
MRRHWWHFGPAHIGYFTDRANVRGGEYTDAVGREKITCCCKQVQRLLSQHPRFARRRLLQARILLKADVSEASAGWSDSKIIAALDTSAA